MITIQNQTERVIVVYNDAFSAEIPIGETVTLEKEQLGDTGKLFCRYFSDRGEEIIRDFGFKQNEIWSRHRLTLHYENISAFRMVTAFDLQDGQTVTVKDSVVRLQPYPFKTVHLYKPTQMEKKKGCREEYFFQDETVKKRFLKLMRVSTFFLPLALFIMAFVVYCLFSSQLAVGGKIASAVICCAVSGFIFYTAYYYFAARKWKIV